MLVFKRKPGETIRIGDDIVVTLVECHGSVRIGVDAPREVTVHRGEVLDRIQRKESAGEGATVHSELLGSGDGAALVHPVPVEPGCHHGTGERP